MNTLEIFSGEPVRYTDRERHSFNNGFRRRWLANGKREADLINAARAGDTDALLARAETMGGLTQKRGWAKSALKAAAKLAADVPAYRIENVRGYRMVFTPRFSWTFKGNRQVAAIEWVPMYGVKIH
jgi:hypothetical protein